MAGKGQLEERVNKNLKEVISEPRQCEGEESLSKEKFRMVGQQKW